MATLRVGQIGRMRSSSRGLNTDEQTSDVAALIRDLSWPSASVQSDDFARLSEPLEKLRAALVSQEASKDVFRHGRGLETLCDLLNDVFTLQEDRSYDDEYIQNALQLARRISRLLAEAFRDHRGNQRYFTSHVEGWASLSVSFEHACDLLARGSTSGLQPQYFASLFDHLLGLALGVDVCDHFTKHCSVPDAAVSALVISDSIARARLAHPQACAVLMRIGLRYAAGNLAPPGGPPLSLTPLLFRTITALTRDNPRNAVALWPTGVLSDVLKLALDPTTGLASSKVITDLLFAIGRYGMPSLEDVAFLFRSALTSDAARTLLLAMTQSSKGPAFIQFDLKLNGFACIEIPRLPAAFPPSVGYTFTAWIRIDEFDAEAHTTLFGAYDAKHSCFVLMYLEKDSHQLILQTSIRAPSPSIRFKSTQFKTARWYHVAIVQRKNTANPSQSDVSLLIDGVFAEQRKCHYPEMPEEILEHGPRETGKQSQKRFKHVQAFFGTSRTVAQRPVAGEVRSIWSLGNAHLYNTPLSDEYIAVHYRLGPRYNGNMQDCMGPLLTYAASAELNRHNETLHPDRSDRSDIVLATEGRGSDVVSEARLLLSICPAAVIDFDTPTAKSKSKSYRFELDRKAIARYQQLASKTEAVVVNIATPRLNEAIAHSYGTGILAGEPAVIVPRPLDDASWCVAGSLPVLLRLLETATSKAAFLESVQIFLESVQDNWRNSEAMERGHGFGLLSIVIREKLGFELGASGHASARRASPILSPEDRSSLPLELLRLLLQFVGYNARRPELSLLVNPMAYRILLIDFDTWRRCGAETQALYYEQFTSFVSGNVNSLFNQKRLTKMRAFKKLVEALKSEEIDSDAAALLMGSLRSLLDTNTSQPHFRDLAMFIAYGLHDNRAMSTISNRSFASTVSLRQKVGSWPRSAKSSRPSTPAPTKSSSPKAPMTRFELAVLGLRLLSDVLNDGRSSIAAKRFHKAVHSRWLLHLLAESDVRVVELTLSIVCRLLMTADIDFRSMFLERNNGFITLKSRLKPFWRSQTIWILCFSIFFGQTIPQDWLAQEFSVFHLVEMFSVNDSLSIVNSEVLPTIFGMLEAGLRKVAKDDEQNTQETSTLHTVLKFLAELYDRSFGFRKFAANSRYTQELLFVLFPLLAGTDRLSAEIELQSDSLSFKGEEVKMRPHSNSLGERPPSVRSLDMQKETRTPSPMAMNRVQAPRRISSFVLISDDSDHLSAPPAQFATPMAPKAVQPLRINVTNSLVEALMELASTLFIDLICYREKFTGIGLFLKVPPAFREHQAYFESYILVNALSQLASHLRLNQHLFTETKVLTNLARYSQHLAEAVSEGWFIDGAQPVLDFTGEVLEHLQRPEIASERNVRLCSQSTNSIRIVFLKATLWRLAELGEDANEKHVTEFLDKMTYWQTILFSAENQETLFTKLICYLLYHKLVSQVRAVRLAAARLWRIVLVQKPTETATMLTNTMGPEHRHLSTGFMKLASMDEEEFLNWVDQNRSTLDRVFDSSLTRPWNDFVDNENRSSDETSRTRLAKRRDKLKQWQAEETAADEFINRYEVSTNHWRANVHAQERVKLQRSIQDHQENVNQLFTAFVRIEKLVSEPCGIEPSSQTPKWHLDETEAANRMRIRIVPDTRDQRTVFQPKRKISTQPGSNKLAVNTQMPRLILDENQPSIPASPATPFAFTADGIDENGQTLRPRSDSISNSQLLEGGFEIVDDPKEDEDGIIEDKNRKVMTSLQRGDMVQQLYNMSRIIGLEACEGLLVIGQKCIYMQDNLFQRSDGEIVSVSQAPEDERDPYLQIISGKDVGATRTKHSVGEQDTRHWTWAEVLSLSKRRFLLRDVSIELFFTDGRSYLLTCLSTKVRDDLFSAIVARAPHVHSLSGISNEDSWRLDTLRNPEDVPKNLGTKFGSLFNSGAASSATKKWQRGEMSNFQYLMLINTMAGRTFNDLTQYPVFPWVLADYSSEELDLENPRSFRDLSKPMGCQTSMREAEFKDRYKQFAEMGDHNAPPFHYGTHYSSAMIVCSYLIRLQPFVQSYLLLQGGSFDHADRLFDSIERAWLSASRDNMSDVRELTPEFFYLPEFLTNVNGYDFGAKQVSEEIVTDVHLPKWAHGDPQIFVAKHREALESRYVSEHLHEWIDLVFGFKQRGEAAIDATNVFTHLSYGGAKDLDKIDDQVERLASIGIIHSFGQTPYQVYQKPHSPRELDRQAEQRLDTLAETLTRTPDSMIQIDEKVVDISFSPEHNRLLAGGMYHLNVMPACRRTLQWGFSDNSIRFYSSHNGRLAGLYENTHVGPVTTATFVDSKTLVTGGQDCTIGLWKVNDARDVVELQPKTHLFGHRTAVTVLTASRVFSTLISASEDGQVLVWGLNRQNCIRVLLPAGGSPIQTARISNVSGHVLLCRGAYALLYTINGHLLVSQKLCDREDEEILSCAFYEGAGNEYIERELIFTGHIGGLTNVWTLTALNDGTWHLLLVKRMSHIDQASGIARTAGITAILPVARGVYTGDEEGNVWSWECVVRQSSQGSGGWGRG